MIRAFLAMGMASFGLSWFSVSHADTTIPLRTLVDNPAIYSSQDVTTSGYVSLSDEGNLLCEDLDRGDAPCLQVLFEEPWDRVWKAFGELNERSVIIQGTFQAVTFHPWESRDSEGRLAVFVGLNLHQLRAIKQVKAQ